jgi:hypothetical protein
MPAYSKTTWSNGNLPAIDDTNLNKIEQGIFDSLRQDGSTTMSGQLVTTAGSAATPAIAPTGDSNTGIFFPAADTIAFGEGGAEAMRINSSGQVGIGTTSPLAKMTIQGITGSPGLTDKGILQIVNSTTNQGLSIGGGASPSFEMWLQSIDSRTGSNSTSPISLNPNGGNVGIGTNNPQTDKLEVNGGIKTSVGSGGGLKLFETDTTRQMQLNASVDAEGVLFNSTYVTGGGSISHFRFQTGNVERVRITAAGNVGIGTTSPDAKLDVADGDLYVTKNSGGDAAGVTSNSINIKTQSGILGKIYSVSYGSGGPNGFGGDLHLQTKADNGSLSTKMLVSSAGNVGIGTTSPTNKLHVTDLALFSKQNNGPTELIGTFIGSDGIFPVIDMRRWTGSGTDHGTGKISVTDTANMLFFTSQAASNTTATNERMRLTYNGYLLIGYTSSNGAYPLQVNGQIFATSSTIATSDGRYKEDIVSLDGALDIVKALNPVQFKWKEHPVHKFNTDVPTVGFIAQEVAEVLKDKSYLDSLIKKSECTWETETGETIEREVTRDVEKQVTREVEREITETVDGEEVTTTVTEVITETIIEQVTEIVTEPVKETHTEEFLGIAESNMIAILTKAIQELNAKVEALEAQLNK